MTDRLDARIIERPNLPGSLGQGRQWELGMCWLYCRRQNIPVIWIGPVQSSGRQAHMYGCADCVVELDHMVWQALLDKDGC